RPLGAVTSTRGGSGGWGSVGRRATSREIVARRRTGEAPLYPRSRVAPSPGEIGGAALLRGGRGTLAQLWRNEIVGDTKGVEHGDRHALVAGARHVHAVGVPHPVVAVVAQAPEV